MIDRGCSGGLFCQARRCALICRFRALRIGAGAGCAAVVGLSFLGFTRDFARCHGGIQVDAVTLRRWDLAQCHLGSWRQDEKVTRRRGSTVQLKWC